MSTTGIIFWAASVTLSLVLIVRLWMRHARDTMIKKIFWSFVLLFPLLGVFLYAVFYDPPAPQGPADQAEASPYIGGIGH